MNKNLVIVESPAKARTIKKYLGKQFEILASYGHVRDLVPKEGAVDPEQEFKMQYQIINRNKKHIDAIAKAAAQADTLYLATDPDREGEAIAWHLHAILEQRNLISNKRIHRIIFHEITERAILDAISNPRNLSIDLVNAQQARRALDYLVGFNLSPLLWKKIKPGLSAGRVQSPALRLIVEREIEIEQFESREYWTIEADTETCDGKKICAELYEYNNKKVTQFVINDLLKADKIKEDLVSKIKKDNNLSCNYLGLLSVLCIERKNRKRNPPAPFTTSTLQQEASRRLGFSTERTMRIAQQLYEGIDIGNGAVGLITYMRTDSVNLAKIAVDEIRSLIAVKYGTNYLPNNVRYFKTKAKNAQEAHEAIRPTILSIAPESVIQYLNSEQYKLYELIWQRTVACQMINARILTVTVLLSCSSGNKFRANYSSIVEPGFMFLYQGKSVNNLETINNDQSTISLLREGTDLRLIGIRSIQHFTEPPPRFSEASLVQTLEEYGIGRPSTYSLIIATLLAREYALLEQKKFKPTEIGRVVNKFLTEHFKQYVDYDFTAKLEDSLDAVSRGEEEWLPLMRVFWNKFSQLLIEKTNSISRKEFLRTRVLGSDPQSGKLVAVRIGRFGPIAQIGGEDNDKPRFARLRSNQNLESITLEEVLDLFKLPRELGYTDEGELVQVNIGRFGPYIRYGMSYVTLKTDDPYTITLDRALELISARRKYINNKTIHTFPNSEIKILSGRFGPYVTNGHKKVRIPKNLLPIELTLCDCESLLSTKSLKRV